MEKFSALQGRIAHCGALRPRNGTCTPDLPKKWQTRACCTVSSPNHLLEGGAASGEAGAPPHQVRLRR